MQEAVDTDDASEYLTVSGNVFVYAHAGLKEDFGGHDVRHREPCSI